MHRIFSKSSIYLALGIALVSLLLLAGGAALAQSGYSSTWWTVDGGGTALSSGGTYTLGGAVGQADAGPMSGGSYTVEGGFWAGANPVLKFFLPVVRR